MALQKVTALDEQIISDIGHAFGYYNYGEENGLVSMFSGQEATSAYIQGYVRGMMQGGFLYSTSDRGEAYIAYKRPGEKLELKTIWPLLKGICQSMSIKDMCRFVRLAKNGGLGLDDRYDKEKKPYIFVGLVCVREEYQGQGYMRKLMEPVFAEGNRLGVPVILNTDAKSKCDKYVHLGMKLEGIRDYGECGKLYDLIKYPDQKQKGELL